MILTRIIPTKERVRFVKLTLRHALLFLRNTVSANSITVDWRENYPVATALDCIVAAAWLLEIRGITLKFRQSSNAMWQHFESDTLSKATDRSEQESSSSREVILAKSMAYIATIFISSEYGHKVITRLSIKEDLRKSANEWFENHIKGDWVAVHYRGTDIRENRNGYCKSRYRIEMKPYVNYLKGVLDSQCSIFACSDQAQFIDEVKAAFPGRVFARDIKRSYDGKPLHLNFVPLAESHDYDQERDALIDVLVLAKAELIYTTGSGFVDVVRYFNPETKIVSLDGRTIGRGKNNAPIPEPDLFKRLSLP